MPIGIGTCQEKESQRNYNENPLSWWDKNKIEAVLKVKEQYKYGLVPYKPILMNMQDKKEMQEIIKEHLDLKLIQPGFSPYSSPGFLVCNHGEIKRGKARNEREHLKYLEIFSDVCYNEGLMLSEKKAVIKVNRIEFLGVLIDEAGIELQEHIVKKIIQFPDRLEDKKQL